VLLHRGIGLEGAATAAADGSHGCKGSVTALWMSGMMVDGDQGKEELGSDPKKREFNPASMRPTAALLVGRSPIVQTYQVDGNHLANGRGRHLATHRKPLVVTFCFAAKQRTGEPKKSRHLVC